ncbi:glyoxalase superfamily protein [Humibacter sp. RRB41]|uniref:glyoxalase superfamily protein n=1 Tax=Humibacter sp. RRB41 TaxID=2919946 RepID=UPI001FA97F87|nr:glyoxalase superfamily protein [Humibacter sp. RRB41]
MDFKIELIFVPVSDVDRAKHFYADQLGFNVDYDQTVSDEIRFVQITPPGSACSIAFGKGLTEMPVGSQRGVQMVIDDADAAREQLIANGVDASEVEDLAWGRFVTFEDPDGNRWTLQQMPVRG